MHINMNNLLIQLAAVLSKEYKIVFRPEKNVLAYTIVPLPPSVFEYFESHGEDSALFDFT